MPTMQEMQRGPKDGIWIANLKYAPNAREADFDRADLEFVGVDHAGISYEVRVFINNAKADDTTPRDAARGYAGRYYVLGHGGCFGGIGHCDPSRKRRLHVDLRPTHALAPQTKLVHVTNVIKSLAKAKKTMETVTLVAISCPPKRKRAKLDGTLAKFETMKLKIYRGTHGV